MSVQTSVNKRCRTERLYCYHRVGVGLDCKDKEETGKHERRWRSKEEKFEVFLIKQLCWTLWSPDRHP
jgi:hypothetical protein